MTNTLLRFCRYCKNVFFLHVFEPLYAFPFAVRRADVEQVWSPDYIFKEDIYKCFEMFFFYYELK